MNPSMRTALLATIVLLAAATVGLFVTYRKTATDLAGVRDSEQQVSERYGSTIQAIAEIQDSLNTISLGDESPKFTEGNLEAEKRMAGPNGQVALDRIALLRSSILRSKDRITQLEASMKLSGIKVTGLQKLIANLKHSVTEKEEVVAILTSRVDSLQTQVTGLTATVVETQDTLRTRDQQVEEKRRELATVYYVVGSKKELSQRGVIRSSGGVLGLGKTVLPATATSHDGFSTLDTDQELVIRTPAAKARVVSAQPASSYELRLVDGHMELHILSPSEFRKVREVIILTS